MLERQLQAKILKWLRERGYYAVKVVVANRNGVPDILACVEGRFVAIEVKSPRKELTDLQKYNLQKIEGAGGLAIVAYGVEDVEKAFKILEDISGLVNKF